MSITTSYLDHLDPRTLATIERQVSDEIAQAAEPTSALLDGTALERRNRRIAARALAGITAQYGVTLVQAVRESECPARPVAAPVPASVFRAAKRTGRKARRAAARRANLNRVA
jgi:hypothetical protein